MGKYIAAALLALTLPAVSSATFATVTGQPQLTEQTYFENLPVVLTASRISQRVDQSPVPVTVIDRQEIKASGARDILALLRLVPGMIVAHDSGITGSADFIFGDRYARRMQVLIDGRSVYTPIFGQVDWSTLPVAIEDIERIEVVRGPDPSAYGANSFLGVINIITRKPQDEQGGTAHLQIGNDGINRFMGRYGGETGSTAWRLTAVTWGDHGFATPPAIGQVDTQQTTFINGSLSLMPGNDNRMNLQFGDSAGHRTIGELDRNTYPPHNLDTGDNFQQIRWQFGLDPNNNLTFSFSHDLYDITERLTTQPVSFAGGAVVPLNYDLRGQRYDTELQQTMQLGNSVRAVWGVGTRLDSVLSASYFSSNQPIYDREYRVFSHAEWQITPKLLGNLGAMWEHADIGGTALSPNAALNYSFQPERTLRLGVSSATRNPLILEQHANQRFTTGSLFYQSFFSTGGLEPERITSYDFGYVGEAWGPDVRLDARVFQDYIHGLIFTFDLPYQDSFKNHTYDFRNKDRATAHGEEVQVDWHYGTSSRFIANYAHVNISSTNIDDRYSSSTPHNIFSMLLIRDFSSGVTASVGYYFLGSMDGLDTGEPVGPQRRLDLHIATPLPGGPRGATVGLTIQSALGSYIDFRQANIFEPRIYADLTVPF